MLKHLSLYKLLNLCMNKIKRLFFDIEVSPNIGFFWTAGFKLNITPDNIIEERKIICICYKWEGEDKVYSLVWNKGNDKELLKEFVQVANQADEIIGHNEDRFDIPWLRTRCLYHNIPVFPLYTTLDTLKSARSKFKFNSNKLDYIAQFLGVGKKESVDYSVWTDIVLKNRKTALAKMVSYCKEDVRLVERVFERLMPYIPPKTHHGVLMGHGKGSCPECGESNLRFVQKRSTAAGTIKVQMQCKNCKKYHTISESLYLKGKLEDQK